MDANQVTEFARRHSLRLLPWQVLVLTELMTGRAVCPPERQRSHRREGVSATKVWVDELDDQSRQEN